MGTTVLSHLAERIVQFHLHLAADCRSCGGRPKLLQESLDYGFHERVALTCENRCVTLLQAYNLNRLNKRTDRFFVEATNLIAIWNKDNDTPSFMAGLS